MLEPVGCKQAKHAGRGSLTGEPKHSHVLIASGRPRQVGSKPRSVTSASSASDPPFLKPLAMVSLAFVSAGASTSPYPNHVKPCLETFFRAISRIKRGRPPPGSRWPPGAKASFSHQDSTGVALMSQPRRMPIGQHPMKTPENSLSESSTY